MKKKTGLIIVSVCALVLAMFALPAFASTFDNATQNGSGGAHGVCLQERMHANNHNFCDGAKAGLGQCIHQDFVDENENGVCDHYEAGDCAGYGQCDGTGNGQCNGYGPCDGTGNGQCLGDGCGNGNGGHHGYNGGHGNCYGR